MVQRKTPLQKPSKAELHSASLRILYWFFAYPDRDWTFTEICKNTNTAKKTALPILATFFNEQVIKKTELGRSWRLIANVESPYFKRIKIASNLANIYSTMLLDQIREAYPQARSITLFGSFRKGEDAPGSDVDIAVEIPGTKQPHVERFSTITTLGYRPNVFVNVLLFSRDNIDINLFSNIVNGIVLDGFLEAKP